MLIVCLKKKTLVRCHWSLLDTMIASFHSFCQTWCIYLAVKGFRSEKGMSSSVASLSRERRRCKVYPFRWKDSLFTSVSLVISRSFSYLLQPILVVESRTSVAFSTKCKVQKHHDCPDYCALEMKFWFLVHWRWIKDAQKIGKDRTKFLLLYVI